MLSRSEVLHQVVNRHSSAGFILRGLVSNNVNFIDITTNESNREKLLTRNKSYDVKVFVMWREVESNELRYRLNRIRMEIGSLYSAYNPLKRQVSRALMMIFDPRELLGFVILKGKLVL